MLDVMLINIQQKAAAHDQLFFFDHIDAANLVYRGSVFLRNGGALSDALLKATVDRELNNIRRGNNGREHRHVETSGR